MNTKRTRLRDFVAPAIPTHRFMRWVTILGVGIFIAATTSGTSDHGDTDRLVALKRHDARIADFYVFTRGDRLVMAATIQGELSGNSTQYRFPTDVVYRFLLDREAVVTFENAEQVRLYGGTIVDPGAIREDVTVEIKFLEGGLAPSVSVAGLRGGTDTTVSFFAGVRDEPFIRSVVIGNNIPSLVVEVPLKSVLSSSDPPTLLAWCTTDLLNVDGPQDELGARAYRSMFPDGQGLNTLHPSEHSKKFNVPPDVVIFDTSRPAAFPNGRDLTDDVVDLLKRPDGPPYPSTNDVPFLDHFPYLAPPHPAKRQSK